RARRGRAVAASGLRALAPPGRDRGLLPERVVGLAAHLRAVAHGGRGGPAAAGHRELRRGRALAGRRPFGRQRADAAGTLCMGGRVRGEDLRSRAEETHQAALVHAPEGPRSARRMSEDKEAFLNRWSRLKHKETAEKTAPPAEKKAEPPVVLPPVEK